MRFDTAPCTNDTRDADLMRRWKDMETLLQLKRRRDLFQRHLITGSAHTPKPEKMFDGLYRKGIAYVQRRRGKPPLLVFVKDV